MAKLIVSEFVTLDGVMEAPGGEPTHPHTGWVFDFMDSEQLGYKFREIMEAGSHLLGRVTYESFAGAWPARVGPFAEKINAMPKYVVSSTLKNLAWTNCHVISGDIAGGIARLKAETAGPILAAGSCSLIPLLMDNGLVDEWRLMVFPVVLGSGKRLFPESPNKTTLKLTGTEAFPLGVVFETYVTADNVAAKPWSAACT